MAMETTCFSKLMVPTKHTFVHFSQESEELDTIKRSVSCPAIMTVRELCTSVKLCLSPRSSSGDSATTKTPSKASFAVNPSLEDGGRSSFSSNGSSDTMGDPGLAGSPFLEIDVGMLVPGALSPEPSDGEQSPWGRGCKMEVKTCRTPASSIQTQAMFHSTGCKDIPSMRGVDLPKLADLIPRQVGPQIVQFPPPSPSKACSPKAPAPQKTSILAMQKRINREVMKASKWSLLELQKVIDMHLDQMNGVNLATSFHRLAKSPDIFNEADDSTFHRMLDAAERCARQELALEDGTLPAGCCTIIAWSCAVLQSFRPSLFEVLALVATPRLSSCQAYEITNLLWAFAELEKYRPNTAKPAILQSLLDSVAEVFMSKPHGDLTVQVLSSALMSTSALSWQYGFPQIWLCSRCFQELAARWQELSPQGHAQIPVALARIHAKSSQLYENLVQGISKKYPHAAQAIKENAKTGRA